MVDKAKTSGVERMLDPIGDRVVKDVARPPRYPMSTEKLYHTVKGKSVPDVQLIREHLNLEGHIAKECLI